jgi:hypothetical protein
VPTTEVMTRWLLAFCAIAVLGGCRRETLAPVGEVAAGARSDLPYLRKAIVGEEPDRPTTVEEFGSYPGFDTSIYPGDDTMRAWYATGIYRWVGFYLPSPCHKDASWSGKRQVLKDMGWGLAVVYVGQQTWGTEVKARPTAAPRQRPARRTHQGGKPAARAKRTSFLQVSSRPPLPPGPRGEEGIPGECRSTMVDGVQGRLEGDHAIRIARNEGFPAGTVIFLDVERMETVPDRMRDYYRAWVKRLLEDGTYRPAIYAHTHNAKLIHGDVRAVYDANGRQAEAPHFWIASTRAFSIDKAPADVGHAFATIWQGIIDTHETRAGRKLLIDVNVATTPSPSIVPSGTPGAAQPLPAE